MHGRGVLRSEGVKGQDIHNASAADTEPVWTGDNDLGGVETAESQVVAMYQPQGRGQLHHIVPHQLLRQRCCKEKFRGGATKFLSVCVGGWGGSAIFCSSKSGPANETSGLNIVRGATFQGS